MNCEFSASHTSCLKVAAMSKHTKYFSALGNGAMRVAGLPVTSLAPCRCCASPAVIGFARTRSYAKVFSRAIRRHRTAPDNLPRLPRLRLKKSGQRKANRCAMPRPPRLAPTIFNVYRMKKEAARRVWCAGRESNSRLKTGFMQRNRATQKVLPGLFTCGYEAARFAARLYELKLGQLAFLSLQLS